MKKLVLAIMVLGLLPGTLSRGDNLNDSDMFTADSQDEEQPGELIAFNDTDEGPGPASVSDDKSSDKHERHGPCGKMNLDDAQKAKIKEASFKFREEKIDLVANLQKAKLNYQKVVSSPDATFKSAERASKEVAENLNKLVVAKQEFKNKVAFEILKPEQRGPARFCMMMHKHRHHRHGGEDRWGRDS